MMNDMIGDISHSRIRLHTLLRTICAFLSSHCRSIETNRRNRSSGGCVE